MYDPRRPGGLLLPLWYNAGSCGGAAVPNMADSTIIRGLGGASRLAGVFAAGCLPASMLWVFISSARAESITLVGVGISNPPKAIALGLWLTLGGSPCFGLGTLIWRQSLRKTQSAIYAFVAGLIYPVLVEAQLGQIIGLDLLRLPVNYVW